MGCRNREFNAVGACDRSAAWRRGGVEGRASRRVARREDHSYEVTVTGDAGATRGRRGRDQAERQKRCLRIGRADQRFKYPSPAAFFRWRRLAPVRVRRSCGVAGCTSFFVETTTPSRGRVPHHIIT